MTFIWILFPSSEFSWQTNGCKTDIEYRGVGCLCCKTFCLCKVVARMDRDSSLHLLSIAVHCWVQTLSIFGYSVQFCVRSGRFGKKILNTLYFFCLVFFLFVHTYEWFIYVLQFVLNKFIEKCKRQSLLKWKVSVNLNLCPFLRQPPIYHQVYVYLFVYDLRKIELR